MQAISNSLWSYSKLAYNPGHRVLDVAARRAASMLHQYTSQVPSPAKHHLTTQSSLMAFSELLIASTKVFSAFPQ